MNKRKMFFDERVIPGIRMPTRHTSHLFSLLAWIQLTGIREHTIAFNEEKRR